MSQPIPKKIKEKNPEIKGVLADPVGSVIGGGEHADYDIEGIGNGILSVSLYRYVLAFYKINVAGHIRC